MDEEVLDLVPVNETGNGPKSIVTYSAGVPAETARNLDRSDWAITTAGSIELTEKEKKVLYADIHEDDVEIRPDGLTYLPWMEYAKRLREAFGLQWSLVEVEPPRVNENLLLWKFYLVIKGRYCGTAIGEQTYNPNNRTMTWGDACEGAKSNALMRLCKGIGIGLELWQPQFIKSWIAEYAEYDNVIDGSRKKKIWRKKESIALDSDTMRPIDYAKEEKDKANEGASESSEPTDDKAEEDETVKGKTLADDLKETFEAEEIDSDLSDSKKLQMVKFINACNDQKEVLKAYDALPTWDKLLKKHKVKSVGAITDRDDQKTFYNELSTLASEIEKANWESKDE